VEEFVRESIVFSVEELDWVMVQPRCVKVLWFNCMVATDSGEKVGNLKTQLGYQSFNKAKNILNSKLFEFIAIKEHQEKGRPKTVGWKVRKIVPERR